MNDTFGDQRFNTTTTEGGAQSAPTSEGVAPVFIKQILQAPEGAFQLFGLTFRMITGVVLVRSQQRESTKIQYLLEDNTGQIEANMMISEEDGEIPDLMENSYARYYGGLRYLQGKPFINIYNIQPISGPNEIVTHGLEVLHTRYKAEKLSKGPSTKPSDFASNENGFKDNNMSGLTQMEKAVFDAIRNARAEKGENGISINELKAKFRHIPDITKVVEKIANEGLIFSTIDDLHYGATEYQFD